MWERWLHGVPTTFKNGPNFNGNFAKFAEEINPRIRHFNRMNCNQNSHNSPFHRDVLDNSCPRNQDDFFLFADSVFHHVQYEKGLVIFSCFVCYLCSLLQFLIVSFHFILSVSFSFSAYLLYDNRSYVPQPLHTDFTKQHRHAVILNQISFVKSLVLTSHE